MHIIIHPNYQDKKDAITELIPVFFSSGRLIVKGSRNTIKTNYLESLEVNIKYFKAPSLIPSFIYTFIRPSKAKRSFEYAKYLIEHEIKTPFPIAYIEEKKKNLLKNSFYICEHLNYDFTFRELIHDPLFPERNLILEQFTEFTYQMHEAKILFKDHSPGNTLILNKGNGQYEFYLIDLNRMSFKELSLEERMDNLKKLWLSKKMIRIISKKYAELIGEKDEAKLYNLLLEKSNAFKKKTARKKYLKSIFKKNKTT